MRFRFTFTSVGNAVTTGLERQCNELELKCNLDKWRIDARFYKFLTQILTCFYYCLFFFIRGIVKSFFFFNCIFLFLCYSSLLNLLCKYFFHEVKLYSCTEMKKIMCNAGFRMTSPSSFPTPSIFGTTRRSHKII